MEYILKIFFNVISRAYNFSYMMSVVGKSTCLRFKTGLFIIYYHGGNAVRYIKQRGNVKKDARIPGNFDTK